MKALLIGHDGAAHPVAWKLAQSPAVGDLYTAPGNYGTNLLGANLEYRPEEVEAVARWAQEQKIDLVVVTSPVAALYGAVEACREAGVRVVGASRPVALLETSRRNLLEFLTRHELPTERYAVLESSERAASYLQDLTSDAFPLLLSVERPGTVQAGSTLVENREAALSVAYRAFASRTRGPVQLVVEEYPSEPDASLVVLADSTATLPVGLAHIYYRALEGDTGPLVTGMGAYAPLANEQARIAAAMNRVVTPLLAALAAEGEPYSGPLCIELRGPSDNPSIAGLHGGLGALEPHVLLPRWEDDLFVILYAIVDQALAELRPFRWSSSTACSVVLASGGFPGEFETGYGILGLGERHGGAQLFHLQTRSPYARGPGPVRPKVERDSRNLGRGIAGWFLPGRGRGKKVDSEATRSGGDPYSQVITAGGLVLSSVGTGKTLFEARAAAYRGAEAIEYTGRWFRTDIGVTAER